MKIIFLGTPDFAKNVLSKLIESEHQVVAVVCQPDKPVGRKQILTMPPVKELALKHNIKVFQFNKIKKEGLFPLSSLNADIMVTAAYGQILSQEILDITKFGVINVHASLLPKYRGSSPVQWALINGEKVTGVTIMKTDRGMDTGDMIIKQQVDISSQDTVTSLLDKLSKVGADLLIEALKQIENGSVVFEKQNNEESTYFPMLNKEMAKIDFNSNAENIVNFIRGLEEWPTAYLMLNGQVLKIFKAQFVLSDEYANFKNGYICKCNGKNGLIIKAQNGVVVAKEVQYGSGKRMDAKSFANGHNEFEGLMVD